MAKAKIQTEYDIILGVEQSDETRQAINQMTREFDGLADKTRAAMGKTAAGLNEAFGDVEASVDGLVEELDRAIKSGHDADKIVGAFGDSSAKAMANLEKAATALQDALTEEGAAARDALTERKKALELIKNDVSKRAEAKKIQREIKALQKKTIEGSETELRQALKRNQMARAALIQAQKNAKLALTEEKTEKRLRDLLRDDLRLIKEKISAQLEFVRALRTTEGRYKAVKKAAAGALGAAGTGVKLAAGGVAAGLVGGVASALGGSADTLAQKGEAARRIRGSYSDTEKNAILSAVRINTGADFSVIIAAINRVQRTLGAGLSQAELINAATIDIQAPGALDIVALNTEATGRSVSALNKVFNTFRESQSRTGLSAEDFSAAVERATSLRRSRYQKASVNEIANLDALLTSTGAVNDEQRARIVEDVLRRFNSSGAENLADFVKGYDWTRTLRGDQGTAAIKLSNALQNTDFSGISRVSSGADMVSSAQTAEESVARETRRLEDLQTKLALEVMRALEPILSSGEFQELLDAFFSLIKELSPLITNFLKPVLSVMKFVFDKLKPVISDIISGLSSFFAWVREKLDLEEPSASDIPGTVSTKTAKNTPLAAGGMAYHAALCGEAGPELVIPMGYTRQARAENLTERYNLVQNFTLSPQSSQTAYSIAGAMRGTRSAARDLAAISRRGGRLNG